ncbi:hypothetical protein IX51_02165 [uncultured archaeon]|nr:hypothetical protein IX51_02165 [uncultured archaeon]HKJ96212.1 50S ribosomal protein L10 [Thermoplasmataceae archaeon]
MTEYQAKVAQWKVDAVEELKKEIESHPVVAIVDITGIGNQQLQNIRRDLKGKVNLRVVRRRLFLNALEKVKRENIQSLKDYSDGQIALLTSEKDPKTIYDMLFNTRQDSPAKGGELAPMDIVVEEAVTGFPPGPMISEFQKVGLKTAIEKGKIVIKGETVLVKEGEPIPRDKAKILEKLDIKPINVGLDIIGAYSDGIIFTKNVLSVKLEDILGDIGKAFSEAKGVALETMFIVPEVLPDLLFKAKIQAEQLALESGYMDESNIELFILKAIREATALSGTLGGEEEASEEAEEEPEQEEKKEEGNVDENISEGLGSLFG